MVGKARKQNLEVAAHMVSELRKNKEKDSFAQLILSLSPSPSL